MTKTWKDRAFGGIVGTIAALIPALIIMSYTQKYDEKQSIKEKLQQIEIEKASTDYVDQKCKEVKEEAAIDKAEILTRLDALQSQNNQIYQILIEKK